MGPQGGVRTPGRIWHVWSVFIWSMSLPVMISGQSTPAASASADWTSKLSPVLQAELPHLSAEERIRIEVVSRTPFFQTGVRPVYSILSQRAEGKLQYALLSIASKDIQGLALLPDVLAIEVVRDAYMELKQEGLDLSLNEVTWLRLHHPQLNGSDQTVSIKEHRFDTTDIDFKGRLLTTGLTPLSLHVHSTNMASVIGGAGNSDPSALGVAPDIQLTSSDFNQLLPDPDAYFMEHGIMIQNHSYGTGVENYYGIETKAYDDQCHRMPELMHVFSSGNAGDETSPTGAYSHISGWANLTGQFKQSKNTITVGATDSLAGLWPLSSKGPAYDGRLKPEVTAYGHGGTSGAAAIVSGIMALLQQAFIEHYGGRPPAALLKAILIHSARDIGRPGPDFETGYGTVRAKEAVDILDAGQFVVEDITPDDTLAWSIQVPEGISTFKVTMAWHDPPAEWLAQKSLVHDLDMEIVSVQTGERWRPWVLSGYPHPDSLQLEAHRGMDTLNNVEQSEITNPAPGEYQIQCHGHKLSGLAQSFALAWSLKPENIFWWTWPAATDDVAPDRSQWLRWSTTRQGSVNFEYRMLSDHTGWHPISGPVNITDEYVKWRVPAEPGLYQVRCVAGDTVFTSDTFLVADALRPSIGFWCQDSLRVEWNAMPRAERYAVYTLGEKRLEELAETEDTTFLVKNWEATGFHFAVAPVIENRIGPKSPAIDIRSQAVGCYLNAFFLRFIDQGLAHFEARLGSLYGVKGIRLERKNGELSEIVQSVMQPEALIYQLISGMLTKGVNFFRLVVILENEKEFLSDWLPVYYLGRYDVLVYPNPVPRNGTFYVMASPGASYTLELLDMQGSRCGFWKAPDNPQPVAAADLVKGMYVLLLRYEDGGMEVRRVLVPE